MPLDDINAATFRREAERALPSAEATKVIADFAKLNTADDRLAAFRKLRGGSVASAPMTKLGKVENTA